MKKTTQLWLVWCIGGFVALGSVSPVRAHGGEVHSDEKPATTQTNTNVTVRVARAGDYEIMLKHAALEPDKPTGARIFVTRFATNEPATDAQVVLLLTGARASESNATATETPGVYEAKLPPLPAGDVTLRAKINVKGATTTAALGTVTVAPPTLATPENATLWARTALLALGALAVLGILSATLYFGLQAVTRRKLVEDEG